MHTNMAKAALNMFTRTCGSYLKDIGIYSHQSNKFPMEVHLKFYEEKANSENILNIGDRISAIIEDSVNKK